MKRAVPTRHAAFLCSTDPTLGYGVEVQLDDVFATTAVLTYHV